jgi:hypothetical protein
MYGLDDSWVMASTPVAHAGDLELAMSGLSPNAHPLVGGATWGPDGTGMGPDTGLTWQGGSADAGPPAGWPAGASTRAGLDDWRNALNPHSPMFWLGLSLLVVVGLLHLQVNTRVGPAHGNLHIGH